jgi:hypothetical protein
VANLQAQHLTQGIDHGLKLVGHKTELAQAKKHGSSIAPQGGLNLRS